MYDTEHAARGRRPAHARSRADGTPPAVGPVQRQCAASAISARRGPLPRSRPPPTPTCAAPSAGTQRRQRTSAAAARHASRIGTKRARQTPPARPATSAAKTSTSLGSISPSATLVIDRLTRRGADAFARLGLWRPFGSRSSASPSAPEMVLERRACQSGRRILSHAIPSY